MIRNAHNLSNEEMSSLNPDSALAALLVFTGWTALHVILLAVLERFPQTLSGEKQAHQFAKSRTYGETTLVGRIACHHQNCLENLPLFAAVVLVNAHVTSNSGSLAAGSSHSIDREAWFYVYSRILQGLVHWYKVNHTFAVIRFLFFGTGFTLLFVMGFKTFG